MDLACISSPWLLKNLPSGSCISSKIKTKTTTNFFFFFGWLFLLCVDPLLDLFLQQEVGCRCCSFWQMDFVWMHSFHVQTANFVPSDNKSSSIYHWFLKNRVNVGNFNSWIFLWIHWKCNFHTMIQSFV